MVGISIVTYITIYFVTTVTQLPAPTSANATDKYDTKYKPTHQKMIVRLFGPIHTRDRLSNPHSLTTLDRYANQQH